MIVHCVQGIMLALIIIIPRTRKRHTQPKSHFKWNNENMKFNVVYQKICITSACMFGKSMRSLNFVCCRHTAVFVVVATAMTSCIIIHLINVSNTMRSVRLHTTIYFHQKFFFLFSSSLGFSVISVRLRDGNAQTFWYFKCM